MMTLHETQPMTAHEAAQIVVILLDSAAGRISHEGKPPRPWLYVNVSTQDEAMQLYGAFGCGFIKPRRDGPGWRYGAIGNDALVIVEHLLDAGLNGNRGAIAEMLLERYGNDGRPWASEFERLRYGARRVKTRKVLML